MNKLNLQQTKFLKFKTMFKKKWSWNNKRKILQNSYLYSSLMWISEIAIWKELSCSREMTLKKKLLSLLSRTTLMKECKRNSKNCSQDKSKEYLGKLRKMRRMMKKLINWFDAFKSFWNKYFRFSWLVFWDFISNVKFSIVTIQECHSFCTL